MKINIKTEQQNNGKIKTTMEVSEAKRSNFVFVKKFQGEDYVFSRVADLEDMRDIEQEAGGRNEITRESKTEFYSDTAEETREKISECVHEIKNLHNEFEKQKRDMLQELPELEQELIYEYM